MHFPLVDTIFFLTQPMEGGRHVTQQGLNYKNGGNNWNRYSLRLVTSPQILQPLAPCITQPGSEDSGHLPLMVAITFVLDHWPWPSKPSIPCLSPSFQASDVMNYSCSRICCCTSILQSLIIHCPLYFPQDFPFSFIPCPGCPLPTRLSCLESGIISQSTKLK